MMGKAAQRKKTPKAAPAGDVHTRIAAEAKAARDATALSFRDAEETPALRELIDSATGALTARIPSTFEHEGRTYYLRVSIGAARLMVFETVAAAHPMVCAITGSHEEFGHEPYH